MSWLLRRFFWDWDCLGAICFVGVLVFVILTFFKEGIGNNLTMPYGTWVLILDFWVLILGS